MYWNILVWLRIEIPDGFLHQISENLKIDDLVTGGTINLQLTQYVVDTGWRGSTQKTQNSRRMIWNSRKIAENGSPTTNRAL